MKKIAVLVFVFMCLFVGNCNAGIQDKVHGQTFYCLFDRMDCYVTFDAYTYALMLEDNEGIMKLQITQYIDGKKITKVDTLIYKVINGLIYFVYNKQERFWITDGLMFIEVIPDTKYINTKYLNLIGD